MENLFKNYYETLNQGENLNIKHEIDFINKDITIYSKPYRKSEIENQLISKEIKDYLSRRIIQPSTSKYSPPIVLIRKNDGSIRFCNTILKPFPIPHMDELLETLQQGVIYSSLDLESGFHQINMSDHSKQYTAFMTRDGHFEWNKMPFGLINAPFTFQRIMNHIFKNLLWKTVLVYMDDILIFSKDTESHKIHLKQVFTILSSHGLIINTKKCKFFYQEIDFLGLTICNGKMIISEKQKQKSLSIKVPTSLKELKAC